MDTPVGSVRLLFVARAVVGVIKAVYAKTA